MPYTIIQNLTVLEGLDGSGTTTQTRFLVERFTREGLRSTATCEPSRNEIGALARRILKRELSVDPRTLALLFAADRNEHLFRPMEGILALAAQETRVVCDRYLFSSLAYQSAQSGFDFVFGLNHLFPLPENLFFLDVPPEECHRRMAGRPGVELFEDLDMQQEILSFYWRGMRLFQNSGMRFFIVDGTAPPEAVHEKIWSFLNTAPIQRE